MTMCNEGQHTNLGKSHIILFPEYVMILMINANGNANIFSRDGCLFA